MKAVMYYSTHNAKWTLYNTLVFILHRIIQKSFIDMESMFKLFTEEEEVILKLVVDD
jgi:hypothetical protein